MLLHNLAVTTNNTLLTQQCGHRKVGDGTHLLVCKKVNAGQIAAHDVAVDQDGWSGTVHELNSYGVLVRGCVYMIMSIEQIMPL